MKYTHQQIMAAKAQKRLGAIEGKASDADRLPLTGKELKCVEYLVGMESRIAESGDTMRERLRRIPNGWRNFRLIFSTLDRLLTDLYDTVPYKGRLYLRKLMEHGEIIIREQPTVRTSEWNMIKDEDLATLVNTAMASECAICLRAGKEAKKCKLRRALEDFAPPSNGHPAGGCGYTNVVLGAELGNYVKDDCGE